MTQQGKSGKPWPRAGSRARVGTPGAELPASALAREGGFLWDLMTDEVSLDSAALAVFDLGPEEFDGKLDTLIARMFPEESSLLRERARTDASEYGSYVRVRTSDRALRWAYMNVRYTRGTEGTPLWATGTIRDAGPELDHAAQQTALSYGREHGRETDSLLMVTTELSRVLTVEDLLTFVTGQSFLDIFGASGVVLSVLDQKRRRLLSTTGLPADLLRDLGVARVDSPLPVAEAIRDQVPMFITREEARDRYPLLWPYIEATDLTATAIIPLTANAHPAGALAILYTGTRDFDRRERNLLLALGAVLSQSIHRGLLYDRERAMSVALQQSMLPARIPHVPGLDIAVRHQPADTGQYVGGDWYDVIPGQDGKALLVVGDVQGHDVRATAIMWQLRSAWRAYAGEGHRPAAIMAKTSRFLQELDTALIATCVCVEFDPTTGTGQVVRAGHPHPMVRRDGAHNAAVIPVPGGLPLGVPPCCEDDPYPTSHLQLGYGTTLLLCTDGLLESRDCDFGTGERRICELLGDGPDDLDELADHIITTVRQRQGQDDDTALLLASTALPAPPSALPRPEAEAGSVPASRLRSGQGARAARP